MLSNLEIKKRLLGGLGTSEGAKKGWVTRRKRTKTKNKKKCINVDTVKIYSKNVSFKEPMSQQMEEPIEQPMAPPMAPPMAQPIEQPMAPPMAPKKPLLNEIFKEVDRMSLKDVIAMNKKLSGEKPKAKPKVDFRSELKQQVLKPKLKKASERVLKEPVKKELSLHEQLMRDLQERKIPVVGEGMYGGRMHIPNQEFRNENLSINMYRLLQERNKYGFGY
jgi:hypothetical protein